MPTVHPTVAFIITSESPTALRAAEAVARETSSLDSIATSIGRAFPQEIQQDVIKTYRLGDYFQGVEITDDYADQPMSFKIVFHVRDGADRFWKDAMVMVLKAIRSAGASVTPMRARHSP